jgi:YYY domain-containing protein
MTFAWAFAFTRIYTRPVTRVAASRWIYQNIPGPINLKIDTGDSLASQPVAFRSGYTLRSAEEPLVLAFRPRQAGELLDVRFEHLASANVDSPLQVIDVAVSDDPQVNTLASAQIMDVLDDDGDPRGKSYSAPFGSGAFLDPSRTYYLIVTLRGQQQSVALSGAVSIALYNDQGTFRQALPEPVDALRKGQSYQIAFTALESGRLQAVELNHVVDWEAHPEAKTLRLAILDSGGGGHVLGAAEIQNPFSAHSDARGESYRFSFAPPVDLAAQEEYALRLEHADGPGVLAVYGSKQANESSWDDALPVSLDGYNAYDYNYGIYRSDLNFEMYWDDNPEKLERFLSILDQADVLFISSNRQWGTTVRLPERYPLTSQYYRSLLGCPAEKEITWCYSVAEPGLFAGQLGFELAAVFQSDPNLGSLRFNTQFAEEAFTVYDHPKVLIFTKTTAYDPERVKAILEAVDLSTVIHLTPRKAGANPGNLLLPASRLARQRAGGTWSELFDMQALANRFPAIGALAWYAVIALLGWVVYPMTRLALGGLPDRGYPLARLVGMLVLAYPVWLLGSYQVPFSRLTITLVFAGLLAANLVLAYARREALAAGLRGRWKYLLLVEGLALLFFLVFLFVRLGNPDLWHPWKGGEKPMDFSYFNAVLKSTSFPPYDPWFAGGYINYYYYGFVLVGVPVKWLGIAPALAYNLILPTLFSFLAMGAFSVGWNLLSATLLRRAGRAAPVFAGVGSLERQGPLLAGLGAAAATVLLGNWGTVRMIWHGLQKLADMQVPFEAASFPLRVQWTVQGLVRLVTVPGTRLPYGPGDWYWIPSRAIPGEPITEFPAFTFLYADPHAHLIALPVTLLALAWALSVLLGRWNWRNWGHLVASFLLGGLAIGALRPTNTWDWPAFLAIGCAAVGYTALRYGQHSQLRLPAWLGPPARRLLFALGGVLVLVLIAALLYQPYASWYGEGYNQVDPWNGARTPFWSYLTHWGVFLFVIVSWLAWETLAWMAATPVSGINRLRPFRAVLVVAALALVGFSAALAIRGVAVGWLVVLLGAWCGVLLLRPGMPDAKRAVLFLTGAALALSLFVELAVLRGDVGRMNTVFKFYLQAWTFFALSAGSCLFWLLPGLERSWRSRWQVVWEVTLVLLVSGALLFPVLAGLDKINDRMVREAPHTLDGMAYMAYATYPEGEHTLDLGEDYRAIRWMQKNVAGSPVIVEANVPEYRWGSRFTIYTGLPGVAGWNWHQRQQRAITPGEWVFNRVNAIGAFYNTFSRADAQAFLRRYAVEYIVVGQLERAVYSMDGVQKFADWEGELWQVVYQDGQTAIYRVIE